MNVGGRTLGMRGAIVSLLVAACFCGGMIALRRLRPATAVAGGGLLDQLRVEAVALRPFDDASAAAAVARKREWHARLWNEESLERWKRGLPARWRLQEAQAEERPCTSRRRFVLTLPDATAKDWSEIVEFLKALDALPAASADALTLTSSRTRAHEFETVQVIVALAFAQSVPSQLPKRDE